MINNAIRGKTKAKQEKEERRKRRGRGAEAEPQVLNTRPPVLCTENGTSPAESHQRYSVQGPRRLGKTDATGSPRRSRRRL